jgi:hypothetical protein
LKSSEIGARDYPEAVVILALRMVEEQLPRFNQYNTVCDEGGPNISHLSVVELRTGEEVNTLLTCLQNF